MKSAEVAIRLGAEATGNADPLAFSIARLLLAATLIAATLAFGAVDTWAWVCVGLGACLVLFLWAVGSVQQGALKFTWSPLYIPIALFCLLGLAQYWAGLTLDKSDTREALVLLATDVTFFFLAVQLFAGADSRTWRAFGLTVAVFAGSLGLFAILQFASGERRIYGRFDTPDDSLFGPYVNPDHYAGLMEMLIPVAVLCIPGVKRRLSAPALALLFFAAVVAVAALLLSGSRGGLIALSAEIVILSALRGWGALKAGERRLGRAVATTVLAGSLLFSWVDPGWVWKRLGLVVHVGSAAWVDWVRDRKSFTLDSLRMLRDHPVLGIGLGSFETAYPSYQSLPDDSWVEHAHDDYVEALAETGFIGAALILSTLALFIYLAFGGSDRRLSSSVGWVQLGAAVGCCGLLVHSFFDFNLHIPANAAWFAVLAGIASTEEASSKSRHSPIASL